MIDAGIHAVLAKVAALGLDPNKHLGHTLQQVGGGGGGCTAALPSPPS